MCLAEGPKGWSYHLWHYGWTPLSQNPTPDPYDPHNLPGSVGLRELPQLSPEAGCSPHLFGSLRCCCPGSAGEPFIWKWDVIERGSPCGSGNSGLVVDPELNHSWTTRFCEFQWLEHMLRLVRSKSWNTGLMRLNLWFLTCIWTQVLLAFVLTTGYAMLAWLVNFTFVPREFLYLLDCGTLFKAESRETSALRNTLSETLIGYFLLSNIQSIGSF